MYGGNATSTTIKPNGKEVAQEQPAEFFDLTQDDEQHEQPGEPRRTEWDEDWVHPLPHAPPQQAAQHETVEQVQLRQLQAQMSALISDQQKVPTPIGCQPGERNKNCYASPDQHTRTDHPKKGRDAYQPAASASCGWV